MLRSCNKCGRSVDNKHLKLGVCGRCLSTEPRKLARVLTGSWSPGRNRAAQDRMRLAVRRRAGDRCEFVEDGSRCQNRVDLQVHHDRPGYEPECGRLLCPIHHRAVDPHARQPRRKQ